MASCDDSNAPETSEKKSIKNPHYALVGFANSGKSTLFNLFPGDKQTVGNWAGVTVSAKQKSIQLAYTTGGATIGITQVEVDNSDYTSGKAEGQTVLSLGISF